MHSILFLTELLPYPLISGPKTRAYYVLRHLASRCQVTLLSFVRPDDKPEHVAHLASFLDQVHTVPMQRSLARNVRAVLSSLTTGRPAIIAREDIGAMRAKMNQLLAFGQYDLVHTDQITMAEYGLMGQRIELKRVLDQHNATFRILERLAKNEKAWWKRLLLQREARAFARYEMDVCQQFDHVSFVTDVDRQVLSAHMPEQFSNGDWATVIPICIDTEAVKPVKLVSDPFRVTHVGTMFWPPNVEGVFWFWENVWPQILAQAPEARLTLIGKNPPDHIQALSRHPEVEVLDFVQDLEPYLEETAAFIVPLHAAGGMRVKIVDAWCWGMPTVSTTIGAEGINVEDGENILIHDAPADFAQSVIKLLSEAELRAKLSMNGRAWVEEKYDWRRVYRAWDDIYGQLIQA